MRNSLRCRILGHDIREETVVNVPDDLGRRSVIERCRRCRAKFWHNRTGWTVQFR